MERSAFFHNPRYWIQDLPPRRDGSSFVPTCRWASSEAYDETSSERKTRQLPCYEIVILAQVQGEKAVCGTVTPQSTNDPLRRRGRSRAGPCLEHGRPLGVRYGAPPVSPHTYFFRL